eukprot:COSAG01_NODE_3984_length_5466_cov_1754.894354_5_plen_124_part_00
MLDLTNSRYGRVVKLDGDVAVFDDVYNPTRRTFSSKNFYAIESQPGISCYQLAGAKEPTAPKPKACLFGDSSDSEKIDSLREFEDSGSGPGTAHVSRARARACNMAEMPPSGSETPNSRRITY